MKPLKVCFTLYLQYIQFKRKIKISQNSTNKNLFPSILRKQIKCLKEAKYFLRNETKLKLNYNIHNKVIEANQTNIWQKTTNSYQKNININLRKKY